MGTDNIQEVNFNLLKNKIDGEKLVKKAEHRKAYSMVSGKKRI